MTGSYRPLTLSRWFTVEITGRQAGTTSTRSSKPTKSATLRAPVPASWTC
jgi:hypothetical protein